MRAATVMDSDGSAEYQKVKLNPSNWWVGAMPLVSSRLNLLYQGLDCTRKGKRGPCANYEDSRVVHMGDRTLGET